MITPGDVEVRGLRVGYERAGDGPPLVLLHGYVGDGYGTWSPQLEALSDECTVIAWDAPGTGRSDDPPESFTLADFADCPAEFIAALGLDRPHIAGLSWGGGLAIELCRRYPALPRTLVLASAYAGWAGSLAPEEVQLRLDQTRTLAQLAPDRFASVVGATMFSESHSVPAERFLTAIHNFHPVGIRVMASSFAAADLREALPGINVPTLLIYGSEDARAPREVADQLHNGIADSKLVVIEGAGHLCNLEAPERFNDAVRAFLHSPPY